MVQDQRQHRGIEGGIVDRQRLELAVPEIDVVASREATARLGQHRLGAVHRHHPRYERRQRLGDVTGAAAEIAHDPRRVEQPGQPQQVEAVAEQLVAGPVPLPCLAPEELLRTTSTLGQDRCETSAVLLGPG